MLALTIHNPWAWFIAHGAKRIENRYQRTSHRGPLAIHAGKSLASLLSRNDWRREFPELPPDDRLTFGAVVAVAELYDCVRFEEVRKEPFAEGPWCWLLRDVRVLKKPYYCRGMQGLFEVPDEPLR